MRVKGTIVSHKDCQIVINLTEIEGKTTLDPEDINFWESVKEVVIEGEFEIY